MAAMRLVVGLGNPGPQYTGTPHNIGADFVEWLAAYAGVELREQSKFKARVGDASGLAPGLRLLIPTTFMNLSGQAVAALVNYYQLPLATVLVAYDEMAFEPGVVRLKEGGGANGHNGLKDIIARLGNHKDFLRLRIGVGHPGDRSRVTSYLTGARMPATARRQAEDAYQLAPDVLKPLLAGDLATAMNRLHAPASGQVPASGQAPGSGHTPGSGQAPASGKNATPASE